jgi:hypothetical protein
MAVGCPRKSYFLAENIYVLYHSGVFVVLVKKQARYYLFCGDRSLLSVT